MPLLQDYDELGHFLDTPSYQKKVSIGPIELNDGQITIKDIIEVEHLNYR